MKSLVIAGLATAFAVAAPAHAENWRLATYAEDYPATLVFLDTDSVHISGSTVSFKGQTITEDQFGDDGSNRAIYSINANCSTMTYRLSTVDFYKDKSFTTSEPAGDGEEKADSSSLYAGIIDVACAKNQPLGETVDDTVAYADGYFSSLGE